MKEFKEKIPKRFQVGGQDIEVCQVEYCEGDSLGDCFVAQGNNKKENHHNPITCVPGNTQPPR